MAGAPSADCRGRGYGRPIADGRLIPLVIVDTSERQDIEEFVRAHAHLPSGDVTGIWAQPVKHKDYMALVLKFERPAEVSFSLRFNIARQGGLVDQVVQTRFLYLQPGRPGNRLAVTIDNPRILIAVPDAGFDETWNRLWHKAMAREFVAKGMSRQQAREASADVIREWRRFSEFRMPERR